MTTYDTIIFDLDGTLTNPEQGIVNSLIYALSQFDRTVTDRQELLKFIGPPLSYSFKHFCGFSDSETQQAIAFYRQYFSNKGWSENQLLPGVKQLLDSLKKSKKQLLVASSKPEPFAIKILQHFEIAHYFEYIAGATLDDSRSQKADVIAYLLNEAQISNPNQCVMVGDRKHDIYGAQHNHMDAIGLLLGFGSKQELEAAGATAIARNFKELEKRLLS
ncbi:HAD family hydrolase [Streptococcus dentasini]